MAARTSSPERLGIAIQGAGNVATEHLRAYLANPHVDVVAVGRRTLQGAECKARPVGLDPSPRPPLRRLPAVTISRHQGGRGVG